MSDQSNPPRLQGEVQRALGRALLRFQHLERVLKGLVAGRMIAGAPGQAEASTAQRFEQVRGSPLGWLKEELVGKYVQPVGRELDDSEMDKAVAKGHMAFRMSLQIPEADHARLTEHLTVVHERRNQVVHHFLERFDLQTDESCASALQFLDDTHQLLDLHQSEVLLFAKWAFGIHQDVANHLASPDFSSALESSIGKST